MFIGQPPGNYDRLLDVSRAVTGSLFFVPSVPLLESLADDPADGGPDAASPDPASPAQASPDPASAAQGAPAGDSTDTGGDPPAGPPAPSDSAGSLGIGSLRGVTQHG
jgi:putative iron-dependent peroxidase